MNQLQRYSIKIDQSAAGVQVGMAADSAGEFVRVDDLEFFFAQVVGKQAMAVPASFPEKKAETTVSKVQPPKAKQSQVSRAVHHWTDEDLHYLEQSYGVLTLPQIAAHLRRTVKSVEQKAYKLRLGRRAKQTTNAGTRTEPVVQVPAEEPSTASEAVESFDPSNPFIRQIPESAKPGSGRQVKWS